MGKAAWPQPPKIPTGTRPPVPVPVFKRTSRSGGLLPAIPALASPPSNAGGRSITHSYESVEEKGKPQPEPTRSYMPGNDREVMVQRAVLVHPENQSSPEADIITESAATKAKQ